MSNGTSVRVLRAIILATIIQASIAGAAAVGQKDDFENGTTQSWQEGDGGLNRPGNEANGGLAAAGVAGSKATVFNLDQWTGDLIAARITAIRLDVKVDPASASNIRFRVGFEKSFGQRFVSTNPVGIAKDGQWVTVTFPITSADLSLAGREYHLNIWFRQQ